MRLYDELMPMFPVEVFAHLTPSRKMIECSRMFVHLGCLMYGLGVPSGIIGAALIGAARRWERFAHFERMAKKLEDARGPC